MPSKVHTVVARLAALVVDEITRDVGPPSKAVVEVDSSSGACTSTSISTRVPARTLANPIARRAYSSTRLVPLFAIQKDTQGHKKEERRAVEDDIAFHLRETGLVVAPHA